MRMTLGAPGRAVPLRVGADCAAIAEPADAVTPAATAPAAAPAINPRREISDVTLASSN